MSIRQKYYDHLQQLEQKGKWVTVVAEGGQWYVILNFQIIKTFPKSKKIKAWKWVINNITWSAKSANNPKSK